MTLRTSLFIMLVSIFLAVPAYPSEIVNESSLSRAEAFLRSKIAQCRFDNIKIVMKASIQTSIPNQLTKGYCAYPQDRLTGKYYSYSGVNRNLQLPYVIKACVGNGGDSASWNFVYDQEAVTSYEEAMVWVLGHEFWHFLSESGQAQGNDEANANKNGFLWLREFKAQQQLELVKNNN